MNSNKEQQQLNNPTYNRTNQTQSKNLHGARLSGAARKRFHYLLKKGMKPEEAKEQAMKPIRQSTLRSQKLMAKAQNARGINPSNRINSFSGYGQCGWAEPARNLQTKAQQQRVSGSPTQRLLGGERGCHQTDSRNSGYAQFGWTESSQNHRDKIPCTATRSVSAATQSSRPPVQARLGAPVNRARCGIAPKGMPPAHGSSGLLETEEEADVVGKPNDKPNLNVAILPGDYPTELWTTPQLEAVKRSISDLMQRHCEGYVKPSFSGCTFRHGWLSVNGNDVASVNWLMAMDTRLRPWEGASLKVVPESEVPLNRVFVGIFPALYSTPVKHALRLIDAQNEGLAVHDWLVLHRVQKGHTMKLALSIDAHSADVLRNKHYQLNFGFSRVRFRPRKKTAK